MVTYALTVKRPWANLIAAGYKDIENRTWRPWPKVVGTRIAIHAGGSWDHSFRDLEVAARIPV